MVSGPFGVRCKRFYMGRNYVMQSYAYREGGSLCQLTDLKK